MSIRLRGQVATVSNSHDGVLIVSESSLFADHEALSWTLAVFHGGPVSLRCSTDSETLRLNLCPHDCRSYAALSEHTATTEATLQRLYEQAQAEGYAGSLHVENDLRAQANPTRQAVIRAAGQDLVRRFQSRCPTCSAPGYGVLRALPGAPCSACGAPTRLPRAEVWGCSVCGHEATRARPEPLAVDPQRCDVCNP